MPYYFGEGEPGWDEYLERQEAENLAHGPLDRFTYLEPWEAKGSVLRFSRTPRTASESKSADRRKPRASPQHYDPPIWLQSTTSLESPTRVEAGRRDRNRIAGVDGELSR